MAKAKIKIDFIFYDLFSHTYDNKLKTDLVDDKRKI
jgi:hypothetical protein